MTCNKKYAFLGKSFARFIVLVVFATIMLITEKVLNYEYVIVQKAVQEGFVRENWQAYMDLAMWAIGISLVLRAIKVFFVMWVEKVQNINFFHTFNGLLQEDGKMEGALKVLLIASAKVNCVIEVVESIMNAAYIIALMGIVNMTLPEYIGAACILLSGVAFGYIRGKLQGRTDLLGAEIQSLKQKMSTSFMISDGALVERLDEVDKNYWKRIGLQCVKNIVQVMPDVMKVTFFVALFYNITLSGMAEGQIYPYSYVVYTTYGYMVALASSISNLLEYIIKISNYQHDREVKEIIAELRDREEELRRNSITVKLLENGFVVTKDFSLKLIRPNGDEAFYRVPENLTIREGEAILLEGENGTGKSRFCKTVKAIISRCVGYDVKTSIVEVYHENFKRGNSFIDFNLIKYLAKGLTLERIPEHKEEFFELKCSQLNSADRQMLIALQILYFVIKDFEEGKKNVVILDEIFGNLSPERTKIVLPFIMNELSKARACTIVVSHAHKDEVKQYMTKIWQMRNDGNTVVIDAIPIEALVP